MSTDSDHMKTAIALGRAMVGLTAPNPAVGCVIVRDGEVVGRGATGRGGRPHAETVALAEAGEAARGATAYVSLEPCAHHGATPPCADALIAAGVARVVTAIEDPDPRVAGRGHARLREAGIAVATGVEAGAAREANIGFLTRVTEGRPFVQLKLALSADGMIAARPGVRTAITGAEAGRAVHRLRAEADAILVGGGTWAADDPLLTVRLEGEEDRSPIRIVLDARGGLPAASRLVATAREVPLWVVAGEGAPEAARRALEAAGARVLVMPLDGHGRIDLAALLARLGGEGLTRLLVEGGGRVAESLIRARLVDELILFTGPRALGPGGVPAFGALSREAALAGFALASEGRLGADRRAIYRRKAG